MADDTPARWALMLGQLAGEPAPTAPDTPGRHHQAAPGRAELQAAARDRRGTRPRVRPARPVGAGR